jgi:hypothetical protein
MPSVKLITYDLKKEQTQEAYKGFYGYIKKHEWAELSESSYAIYTDATPVQIFVALKPFIDENDWLVVAHLKKPHLSQHQPHVMAWLDKYLEY